MTPSAQRRTAENGKQIDLSATIQGKPFVGAEGLGKFLHDNPKYTACMARKVYAYSRGENSEDVEASAFKAANKAFADSGFRMRALLKAVVEDKDYLQRAAALSRDHHCPDQGRGPVDRSQS